MKAQQVHELGGPEALRSTEIPDPEPGPGQVVIDVRAAGVNFPDVLLAAGKYQTRPELPFTPGSEVAGEVTRVGAGVQGLEPGTRVAAFCGMGGYAEQAAVDAWRVFPIPDAMPYTDAAGFSVTYGTSYHGLVDKAGLVEGERLLVLGAAGGVGLTAVEIGRALGAEVIAAASTTEKLETCRSRGAAELIDYGAGDLREGLATTGGKVDVVYDPVGGDLAQTAVRSLRWGGRYLTVGYASGDIPKVGMNRLLITSGALHGVLWGEWAKRNPERNAANMRRLLDWYAEGRLVPHIDRTVAFHDASAALDVVMTRRAVGKVILIRD
ncbi:NADPH:quinone oxidoreductase family protein [Tomitella fengzijianii]|nr:NADPH:quinone oxidoreductase family protein [Tomitella fengzijianii]